MANVNSPFGLRPVRLLSGSPWNGAANLYFVRSDYATDLFIGDPVVRSGAADTYEGRTRPNVVRASFGATNQLTGAVVGFEPTPTIIADGYGRASTFRQVLVADNPELLFEIQEDADGGAIANASIGLNANLVTGAGSIYHKKSGVMLDSSSAGADATYQLRIQELVQREDNEAATAYAKFLVMINLHTNRLGAVAGL
jgi:hypothetical protein